MPVDMYLYLPLDGSSGDNMSILDHANAIAAIYAKPVEKKVRPASSTDAVSTFFLRSNFFFLN
jgi:hypothetical protein